MPLIREQLECPFVLSPFSERDFDALIARVGGTRAHPDQDTRGLPGSDFQIQDTLIELKILEGSEFTSETRRRKLAGLFTRGIEPGPVVLLDSRLLNAPEKREYDRILETPVKTAIAKGAKQLKSSRSTYPDTQRSILFLVNHRDTLLEHDDLKRIAEHRARNDTSSLNGLIVAGFYHHGDWFDNFFLTKVDYIDLDGTGEPALVELLTQAWASLCEQRITALISPRPDENRKQMDEAEPSTAAQGPMQDMAFELDGVLYLKRTPNLGKTSFPYARQRFDSKEPRPVTPVATVFANIPLMEWERFVDLVPDLAAMAPTHSRWQAWRSIAMADDEPLRPVVTMRVTAEGWKQWQGETGDKVDWCSVHRYASHLFALDAEPMVDSASESVMGGLVLPRYILVRTQQYGQDINNDVSSIYAVTEAFDDEHGVRKIVPATRMPLNEAVRLAAAYAVREGFPRVRYAIDRSHAWV